MKSKATRTTEKDLTRYAYCFIRRGVVEYVDETITCVAKVGNERRRSFGYPGHEQRMRPSKNTLKMPSIKIGGAR